MTVYQSVCGCLSSGHAPDPCDYPDEASWRAAYDAWATDWYDRCSRHHEYCHQYVQQDRTLLHKCAVGRDAECPWVEHPRRRRQR